MSGVLHVSRLQVERLRILKRVDLNLSAGINLFSGPNGSGKTSLLEAVHMLGTGRSFRPTPAREMVMRTETRLLVRGDVTTKVDGLISVGIEQGQGASRIRCAGETIRSASKLARLLPLVLISPDSQRILSDGASLRRSIIDWSLFHVEQRYADAHSRYRRALKQRNAQIRAAAPDSAFASWNHELGTLGDEIHTMRSEYLTEGLALFASFAGRLLGRPIDIEYLPGWDTVRPLEQELQDGLARDRSRGFTDIGPQRADLRFSIEGVGLHRVLSRGESKLFVIAILLSQVEFLWKFRQGGCVVLLDEVAAELDEASRSRVLLCLSDLGVQSILTAVSPTLVTNSAFKHVEMFHVERGDIVAVV